MNYEEEQKLKHRVRRLEDTVGWLQAKLDSANSVLENHKLGRFKYITSPNEEWQRRLDNISARLKMQGEHAAERIRCEFSEHEAFYHPLLDGTFMKITNGILFEQYKKEQEDNE